MSNGKGWLKAQMTSAKREVSGWHGWKKDTIREEISNRLSIESRGKSIVLRSESTGRLGTKRRKI
jgi:hypothetical protein